MHAPWSYKMHSTGTYKITTQAAPNRKIIRTYMTTKNHAHKLEKYPSIGESNMVFPNNILQLVYAITSSDQHTFQKTSCSWSMSSNILINYFSDNIFQLFYFVVVHIQVAQEEKKDKDKPIQYKYVYKYVLLDKCHYPM